MFVTLLCARKPLKAASVIEKSVVILWFRQGEDPNADMWRQAGRGGEQKASFQKTKLNLKKNKKTRKNLK